MKNTFRQPTIETQGYALSRGDGVIEPSAACLELERHDAKTSAVGFLRDARVLLMSQSGSALSPEAKNFIERSLTCLGFKTHISRRALPIIDPISEREGRLNNSNSLNLVNAITKRMKGFGVRGDVPTIGDQGRQRVHPFHRNDIAPGATLH